MLLTFKKSINSKLENFHKKYALRINIQCICYDKDKALSGQPCRTPVNRDYIE